MISATNVQYLWYSLARTPICLACTSNVIRHLLSSYYLHPCDTILMLSFSLSIIISFKKMIIWIIMVVASDRQTIFWLVDPNYDDLYLSYLGSNICLMVLFGQPLSVLASLLYLLSLATRPLWKPTFMLTASLSGRYGLSTSCHSLYLSAWHANREIL